MTTKKKFYVTTAIDYVNAEPHIGHAYQKIVADALARWHKLLGENVWFLTGTDEHGKKVQESAKKAGRSPKEFVDEISEKFKIAWKALNIECDRFIRTTDEDHKKVVKEFIEKCNKAGDIYKGEYEGYYCVGCEGYYTEKDCPDLVCPIHKKPLDKLKEESYFFRLNKYQKFLLDLYKKHPEFVLPESRRNEVTNRVKEGLNDLSITRTSFDWGIPFPLDKKHIIYVWFDALINYVSGAGKNKGFWPAELHILGKDNTWFHTVYWPAMLKSAGYKLPKTVFNHGFLSFNGQKISKSLGNVISPITLAEKYGADTIRYFVLRNFPFASGDDGDFSEKTLIERHNNELANKLGNLVSRVAALAESYGLQKTENKLLKKLKLKEIEKYIKNYELDKAINEIFTFIDECNLYVQDKKPWETHDKKVLFELVDSIKAIAILLWPFMPKTSEKIAEQFGFKISYKEIKKPYKVQEVKKSEILFKKIEDKETNKVKQDAKQENKQDKKQNNIEGVMKMSEVDFAAWEKIDLRVAEIEKIEDIPGADKLYKLSIDVGELGKRVICAGIKKYYKKEELAGKKIIYFSNLAPRLMRGIESKGMLLAAGSHEKDVCVLISPEKDITNGSKIS
jgi:methionyl-tRNA synthetase